MPRERTITLVGKEYSLRYDFFERWFAEKQLGKSLFDAVREGTIESTVTLLWAGVHRGQCKKKLDRRDHPRCDFTIDDMFELLDAHRQAGGEYDGAARRALRAMLEAGVFGKQLDEKTMTRILGNEEEPEGKGQTTVVAQ